MLLHGELKVASDHGQPYKNPNESNHNATPEQ
jgi:hypothetical protein